MEVQIIEQPKRSKKRITNRKSSRSGSFKRLPLEIIEKILFYLPPIDASMTSLTCKRIASLTTSRFWKNLLASYWECQMMCSPIHKARLGLSKTTPAPQIHFLSNKEFALVLSEVENSVLEFCNSDAFPIQDTKFTGLYLPDLNVRNNLARHFTDRQFFIATFSTLNTDFTFKMLVIFSKTNYPTLTSHRKPTKNYKKSQLPSRFFIPISLVELHNQASFFNNFLNTRTSNPTLAIQLAQTISALICSAHTNSTMGRFTIRIPGINTLPPPNDIEKFFVRSTILIAKIPSLCLEFKFEFNVLTDVVLHLPNEPWVYV